MTGSYVTPWECATNADGVSLSRCGSCKAPQFVQCLKSGACAQYAAAAFETCPGCTSKSSCRRDGYCLKNMGKGPRRSEGPR